MEPGRNPVPHQAEFLCPHLGPRSASRGCTWHPVPGPGRRPDSSSAHCPCPAHILGSVPAFWRTQGMEVRVLSPPPHYKRGHYPCECSGICGTLPPCHVPCQGPVTYTQLQRACDQAAALALQKAAAPEHSATRELLAGLYLSHRPQCVVEATTVSREAQRQEARRSLDTFLDWLRCCRPGRIWSSLYGAQGQGQVPLLWPRARTLGSRPRPQVRASQLPLSLQPCPGPGPRGWADPGPVALPDRGGRDGGGWSHLAHGACLPWHGL